RLSFSSSKTRRGKGLKPLVAELPEKSIYNLNARSLRMTLYKYLVAIKYKTWDGHPARPQARSLFHNLTIN
ncbi:MAG: hypothetical protein ACRC6M_01820, partial [Microcystaceae cyanobacterium]